MKLYTIGFTRTTAERFFRRLRDAGVKRLIDTRLHRDGQLSGFAKMPDLEYFLSSLTGAAYSYEPLLVPSEDILKGFKSKSLSWKEYEARYLALLAERDAATRIATWTLQDACLLCSEEKPDHCHRRLAAEFLDHALKPSLDLEIIHL